MKKYFFKRTNFLKDFENNRYFRTILANRTKKINDTFTERFAIHTFESFREKMNEFLGK